jgi:hypothetical protein
MKSLLKNIAALGAGLTLAAAVATAGSLSINANAQNGTNDYDSLNISVPSGAYCSYNIYVFSGAGTAQVTCSGPGVSIDDTIYSGATGGGGAFTSAGGVIGSVYASSYPGMAHAGLTVGW